MSQYQSGLCVACIFFFHAQVVYSINMLNNMTLQNSPLLPYAGSDWITHYDASNRNIWMLSGLIWNPLVEMSKCVMTYNLDTNQWSTKTDLSIAINGRGQFYTSLGDSIYFVGYNYDFGEFQVATQTLLYNPHPTIALPIKVYAPCLVNDGRFVYIIGGAFQNSNEIHYNHLQIYDFLSQKWLSNTPSLQTARSRFACHMKDGRIYIFGGMVGIGQASTSDYTNTIETLYVGSGDSVPTTLSTQTWSTIPTTLSTERNGCIAVSCDRMDPNIVYIVGSREEVTQYSDDTIDVFNINDQNMIPSNVALNRARTDPSVVCVDNLLYVFGGALATDSVSGWNDWEVSNALGFIPTEMPSSVPSSTPSEFPSLMPSVVPSKHPSITPSNNPSITPSKYPFAAPSRYPSVPPSGTPTYHPSQTPNHVCADERTYTVSIGTNQNRALTTGKEDVIVDKISTMDEIQSVDIVATTGDTLVICVTTKIGLETQQIEKLITGVLLAIYPSVEVQVTADFEAEVKDEEAGDMEHEPDIEPQDNAHKPNTYLYVIVAALGGICLFCAVALVCFVCKKKQKHVDEVTNIVAMGKEDQSQPKKTVEVITHEQVNSGSLKVDDEAIKDRLERVSDLISIEGVKATMTRTKGNETNKQCDSEEEDVEGMYVVVDAVTPDSPTGGMYDTRSTVGSDT
eukprot:378025_1